MYKVILINSITKLPHEVASEPVIIFTNNLQFTAEQLMRNRDPNIFRLSIEKV